MLDQENQEIFVKREKMFLDRQDLKAGDFVIYPDRIERVAHVWPDGYQPAIKDQSFYLGEGFMSFSGSLGPLVSRDLVRTDKIERGLAWFFHHNYPVAYGGIKVIVDCPVWRPR